MTDPDDDPMPDHVLNGPGALDDLFAEPVVTDGVTGDTLVPRGTGQ